MIKMRLSAENSCPFVLTNGYFNEINTTGIFFLALTVCQCISFAPYKFDVAFLRSKDCIFICLEYPIIQSVPVLQNIKTGAHTLKPPSSQLIMANSYIMHNVQKILIVQSKTLNGRVKEKLKEIVSVEIVRNWARIRNDYSISTGLQVKW